MPTKCLDSIQYHCIQCGAETEWDPELGLNILCVNCWDKKVSEKQIDDILQASSPQIMRVKPIIKLSWYQRHKKEAAAYQQTYRPNHKEETRVRYRIWYEKNREKVRANQRRYRILKLKERAEGDKWLYYVVLSSSAHWY